jgi:hypothetical protein
MELKTYTAKIRLPYKTLAEVTIEAENPHKARHLLEMQYGKAAIFSGPREVR